MGDVQSFYQTLLPYLECGRALISSRSREHRTWIANLAKSRHLDLSGPPTRLRNVVTVLHTHQRIHGNTERLLDAQRHFRRQRRTLIQQRRKSGTGYAERLSGVRHREVQRLDNLALHEPAGMSGIFHADTLYRVHGRLLVVVLVVEVDNLDLGLVDPKR